MNNKIIEIIDTGEEEEIFTIVESFEILDVATDEEVWAEIEKYIHNDIIATDEEVEDLIERSFK